MLDKLAKEEFRPHVSSWLALCALWAMALTKEGVVTHTSRLAPGRWVIRERARSSMEHLSRSGDVIAVTSALAGRVMMVTV